jgi:AcrR family transcriptional regulator
MSESRDRILTCACELYLNDGFEGFSMRKLAREVGVTAPALYRHFPSKERVLLDVVEEAYKILVQYLHRALRGETPLERFRLAGDAYLEFALDHPRYFQMFSAFSDVMGLDELPEELQEQGCSVQRFWHDRVRECIDARILAPLDPEALGLSLWAHSFGLISLYLRGMLAVSEEEFRTMYAGSFRTLFVGIAAPEFRAMLMEEASGPPQGHEASEPVRA